MTSRALGRGWPARSAYICGYPDLYAATHPCVSVYGWLRETAAGGVPVHGSTSSAYWERTVLVTVTVTITIFVTVTIFVTIMFSALHVDPKQPGGKTRLALVTYAHVALILARRVTGAATPAPRAARLHTTLIHYT